MGKFYQSIQSNGPSFMTKFCSALYLENLLTNIFAKLNLRGGVSCMPAALLFIFFFTFFFTISGTEMHFGLCLTKIPKINEINFMDMSS